MLTSDLRLAGFTIGNDMSARDIEGENKGDVVFEGTTSVAEMARTFDELIGWLGRENSFPRHRPELQASSPAAFSFLVRS